MTYNPHAETIATFTHHGQTYDLDHLGITHPDQRGQIVVYLGEQMVTEFYAPHDSELPKTEELVERARRELDRT